MNLQRGSLAHFRQSLLDPENIMTDNINIELSLWSSVLPTMPYKAIILPDFDIQRLDQQRFQARLSWAAKSRLGVPLSGSLAKSWENSAPLQAGKMRMYKFFVSRVAL